MGDDEPVLAKSSQLEGDGEDHRALVAHHLQWRASDRGGVGDRDSAVFETDLKGAGGVWKHKGACRHLGSCSQSSRL